jgi:hypothetical protein
MSDLKTAISRFGTNAKAKLANPSATGEPEDQLHAPLESLFADFAELATLSVSGSPQLGTTRSPDEPARQRKAGYRLAPYMNDKIVFGSIYTSKYRDKRVWVVATKTPRHGKYIYFTFSEKIRKDGSPLPYE